MPALMVHAERVALMVPHLHGAAVLALQGDASGGIAGNQRNTAVLMHIFAATGPVSDVAALITPTAVTLCARAGASAFAAVAGQAAIPINIVDVPAFVAAVEAAGSSLAVTRAELTPQLQAGAWAAGVLESLAAPIAAAQDLNVILAPILAVADSTASPSLAKAGAVVSAAFKRFGLDYIQKQLSSRDPATQREASEAFTQIINHPDQMPGLEEMDPAGFESALPANVQCGPEYDLKMVNPAQTEIPLQGPVVCVSVASKFHGVVAHGARTFFVQPVAPSVAAAYAYLLELHEKVRSLLTVGKPLKDVHTEAMAFAEMRNATLAKQLAQDFGFSTGLHFMDKAGSVGPRGSMSVAAGSMIALRLVLRDVVIPAEAAAAKVEVKSEDAVADAPAAEEPLPERKVSLILGDTILCTAADGGTSEKALVTKAKRGMDDVSFTVKKRAPKLEEEFKYEPRVTRGATATAGLGLEAARDEKQRELFAKKRADWVAAGSPQGVAAGNNSRPEDNTANGKLARGALFAYPEGIPSEYTSKPNDIHVDRSNHTIILPIGGAQVPFHVSTIAKIEARPEAGGQTALTVTFGTTQQSNIAYTRHRNRQWLREVTYRKAEGGPLYQAMAAVREVQAMLKAKDQRGKQESGLAGIVALKLKANAPRLPSVKLRPAPTGGRAVKGPVVGNLDAHDNGLRFTGPGLTLDIPFENIKHFICQPARKDVVVVIHCALKAPMKLGDKQHTQIQFYAEVIESSEAASTLRRTHEEELAAEERDTQRVRETNRQFAMFAQKVAEISHGAITVAAPFKEIDIDGVGNKRMTRFRGCEDALWAVSELPFTVVSVQDIEIVSLERVLPGQATFDAVFIHKDYRETAMISTIPMTQLEILKDWMNTAGLIYFEGANNVMWTKLLKVMRDDEEWEAWGPEGWIQYVDPHADDEEGGAGSDSDADDSDWDDESGEESDDEEGSDSEWASEGSSSEVDAGSSEEGSIANSDDDDDDDDGSDSDSRKRGRSGKKALPPQRRPAQPGRR